MLHKKGDRNKRLKDRQRPQVQRRRRQQRRQIDKELRDYLVNDEQFQFQPYYREPNFFEPQQLPDWDYIEQGQQDALCELQVEYAISEAESYDWWDQCDKEFKQRKLDKLIQTSQLRVKLLPIFKQQQQQKQQKQQQSTTQINERIFRQVWNNIFLKRLICSKIRTISQDNLIKLENYFTEYMEEYFEDPNLFIERRGIYKIYECPLITVDLFAYHYERCHDKIKGSNDSVLERLSANPRNMVDTWLFRRAFEYMKYTDPCELYGFSKNHEKPGHDVADTCDLPFIIAFHNIDPEAGRLYTIFLYTMSSSFHLGPIHLCSSKNDWLDFQKEFYKHVIKLDYIDDNLQYHIDNRQPFHFNMETKYKPMKLIS
ncbi:hypothetical protein DFA_09110 [Cavenderia fasciculata]|uniref:Uncharacterized protein n=1 Tax=Cavenderia fasciculata TaxID=261658 RepID=F4Q6Q3_CACFS|nr:uncharacterized protein DFA_09110 [Cavenderia fasciculata]EGG16563.1 hypothetical protein DFA_09110 [Cavenderia fasciculata]|eukprot:XP_004354963.1 hypothetical protein DFA_09110 [Cavenderia fasciculata]